MVAGEDEKGELAEEKENQYRENVSKIFVNVLLSYCATCFSKGSKILRKGK